MKFKTLGLTQKKLGIDAKNLGIEQQKQDLIKTAQNVHFNKSTYEKLLESMYQRYFGK
ncbi:MAG: hypothetical protein MJY93_02790 [Fibrobacter sp.]|nr:hypothetical protein [Fibrobacter sp.]